MEAAGDCTTAQLEEHDKVDAGGQGPPEHEHISEAASEHKHTFGHASSPSRRRAARAPGQDSGEIGAQACSFHLGEVVSEAVLGRKVRTPNDDDDGEEVEKHWLIDNPVFTGFIAFLVLLNTMQMGAEVDQPDLVIWSVCEHFFTAAFSIEAMIKISVLGSSYFKQSWNLLDFSLACLSVLDTWVLMLFSQGDLDLQSLSILRILRLVRLVRVVRLMKSAQQMVLVITGVMEAIQTTCWIALVLCMCVYIFGIFFTKTFGRGPAAEAYPGYSVNEEEINEQEIMANYNPHLCFGSLPRSILTLFNIAILSEWNEITRPIFLKQPELIIFFIIFVMFVTFGVMNVFIGMIVEKVTTNARETEDARILKNNKARMKDLETMRDIIFEGRHREDDQGNGVTACELEQKVAENPLLASILEEMELPDNFGEPELVYMLDNDGDGKIDSEELVANFRRLVFAKPFAQLCMSQTGINEVKFLVNTLRKDLLGAVPHPGHGHPPAVPLLREIEVLIHSLRTDMNERFSSMEKQIWASRDGLLVGKAASAEGDGSLVDDGTGGTGTHSKCRGQEDSSASLRASATIPAITSTPAISQWTGSLREAAAQPSALPGPLATDSWDAAVAVERPSPYFAGNGAVEGAMRGLPLRKGALQPRRLSPVPPLQLPGSRSAAYGSKAEVPRVPFVELPSPESSEAAVHFDESGKLGFEVIWSDPPAVGAVHEGQQAARRGVRSGDLLLACNGQGTRGQSRSSVLEMLKTRPVTLAFARGPGQGRSLGAARQSPPCLPEGELSSLGPR